MITGNFYINNTWTNPADADFSYTWFSYINETTLQNVSKPVNYLNLTWSPHTTQNISSQTVDIYSNINQAKVWFNATIPNNVPVQSQIGDKVVYENVSLQLNVTATDSDSDLITYGTNATKGSFNTSTGNFSWTPGFGDAGTYAWFFNSSDGYGGVAVENITISVNDTPLSIISFSPLTDPATEQGMTQNFSVNLNRTANVTWYMNGTPIQINTSITYANYTNSTAGIGTYNVTATASDIYDTATTSWNWTVTAQSMYNVSGYVFDNNGSGLGGVLVKNGSNQNTTLSLGYYQISGLVNGTYNFSYSRTGFNTGYLEVTILGSNNTSANKTIYDTTPPASISSPIITTGNFYINNSWSNPQDADFNHTWFRYSNDTSLTNVSNTSNDLNITWPPHYTQNFSAQTVDVYGNTNQTKVWFNTTIPNNAPVQAAIGNKTLTSGQLLTFIVSATDADNDTINFGTNATNGSLNTTTGNYFWQTNSTDVGTYVWNFNSSDNYGGVANETITITVTEIPAYLPPSPVNLIATQGNFWINHSWEAGLGNDTNSYNVSVNGSWTNGTTATYNNTTVAAHGWSNISVYSYNSSGTGTLNTTPVSQESQLTNNLVTIGNISSSYTVTAGDTISIYPTSSDLDGDIPTFARNFSNGTFSSNNGTLFWTTESIDTDLHSLQINVTDGYGSVSSSNFTITVTAALPLNYTPPSPVSLSSTQGNFWINHSWEAGLGNDTNSYNISVNDIWTNGSANTFNNTTVPAHGWSNISVYAYNSSGSGTLNMTSVSQQTQLANNLVTIGNISSGYTVTAGDTISIYPISSDLDGDLPTFARNFSNGTFSPNNGTLVWTTASIDIGLHSPQINVIDGYGSESSSNFTITVTAPIPFNYTPPSPVNLITTQGNFWINHSWEAGLGNDTNSYNISVNGSWTNGTTSTYNNSTVAAHGWSNISVYSYNSSGTGTLNTTPVTNNTRLTNNLVTIGNISSSYTVTAGDTISIYPTSSDLDGDVPTFGRNFSNGTFYPDNGTLFWTTESIDTGLHSLQINVTDGYGSVSSSNFTITVTAALPLNYTPPSPVNLIATQGNFWINHSWEPGAGNDTNSYNISVNGSWTNGTTSTYDNTTVAAHGWSNISVYSYNSSGTGTLNTTSVSNNTQVSNNLVTIGNISSSYTVTAGDTISIYPTSSDLDGDIPTFGRNFSNGTFYTNNGTLVWTTESMDTGPHSLQINVTDGYGSESSSNFTITVTADYPLITRLHPLSTSSHPGQFLDKLYLGTRSRQ